MMRQRIREEKAVLSLLSLSNKEAAGVFDEQEWAAVPDVTLVTVTAAAVAAGTPDMRTRMP